MWPQAVLGNAEPVTGRQARPADDTVVAVMKDQANNTRYFRFDFGESADDRPVGYWTAGEATEAAKAYARKKVAEEGFTFIAGHVGYVAESGKDYTKTGMWAL